MRSELPLLTLLRNKLREYAVPTSRYFPYGTAGFRSNSKGMEPVFFRCGLIAVLRSYAAEGEAIGVCVTASHNPSCDNGVKLTDPSGGMLRPEFERYATEFINSQNPVEFFQAVAERLRVDLSNPDVFTHCKVILGRDTRSSSPPLAAIVKTAVELLQADCYDLGIVTTPQLHFAVERTNFMNRHQPPYKFTLDDYYTFFSCRVKEFLMACDFPVTERSRFLPEQLVCDGANGVGAQRCNGFRQILKEGLNVNLEIRNDGCWPGDELNNYSGAEFIQKKQLLPNHFGLSVYDPMFLRCCSFDGDADRLIYFSTGVNGELILVDGDKIAALYACTLASILRDIQNECPTVGSIPLRVVIVQTAYANGASTRYLEGLKTRELATCTGDVQLDIACVKTGVKNLHHKAEQYDIGIYFESNGHGTIIMKPDNLKNWASQKGCLHSKSFARLESFLKIFNQATGDAMTDILGVELSLRYLCISFLEWMRLYEDQPCLQRVVTMPRSTLDLLKPHPEHEKVLLQPTHLQEKIDNAVVKFPMARAFIRPSGTEDVCRIYIEALTQSNCVELCEELQAALKEFL